MTVFNTPPFGIRFTGEHNLLGGFIYVLNSPREVRRRRSVRLRGIGRAGMATGRRGPTDPHLAHEKRGHHASRLRRPRKGSAIAGIDPDCDPFHSLRPRYLLKLHKTENSGKSILGRQINDLRALRRYFSCDCKSGVGPLFPPDVKKAPDRYWTRGCCF
jgi:hypothetical protein